MRRLGIVGYGDFIHFFIPYLQSFFDEIIVYSRRDISIQAKSVGAEQKKFEEVCKCEFVCNAVVVQYFEETLLKMVPHLNKGTCVFDVCSVKEIPIQLMQKHLPNSIQIIATHPLFGPKSGKNGIENLNIVLNNISASDETFTFFDSMFKKMKLNVLYNLADDHDSDMAYVQALTHFVAQGIREFGGLKKDTLITTKAYEALLEIEEKLSLDSWLLFESIENYNLQAKNIRTQFINSLQKIHNTLEKN